MPTEEEVFEQRLADAEKERAEREAKREKAAKVRRLLALDLEAKYEGELGAKGSKFDVVVFDSHDTVVALKAPDGVTAKTFAKASKGNREATQEDAVTYVKSCLLYPTDAIAFWKWLGEKPSAVWELVLVLKNLEGARLGDKEGKP